MGRSKRAAVQKYHDRVAHVYDDTYRDAFWQWHDALTWDYLKPHLPRDVSAPVLDLGCGTGKWALKLLKSGFRVVCVDISAKMLDEARRNIEAAGLSARAEFLQADLNDLAGLSDKEAALAVAFGEAIGCAASPPQALRQIRRTLRAGGLLVATFDNRLAAIDYYLSSGDAETLGRFLRDGRTHWLTKDSSERFEIATYGPSELCKLVEGAGFDVIELVGKTVLPMRQHRVLLEDGENRRMFAKIERGLSRDPGAIGRAAHLQIVCRAR